MDHEVLIWGPWVASGLSLALSGLSLLYAASLGRRADARARRRAVLVAKREVNGYWRALDREVVELHGRLDGLASGPRLRQAVSIARTGGEPELDREAA